MKRLRLHFAVLLVSALILGACQGAIKPAETQAPAPEETTLVVWDQFYRDVESQVMDVEQGFEAAHPGVKIERVVKTLDDLKVHPQARPAEANGPDVAQVNQGRAIWRDGGSDCFCRWIPTLPNTIELGIFHLGRQPQQLTADGKTLVRAICRRKPDS